jgi:8-oxo-dGTP diphosphatase
MKDFFGRKGRRPAIACDAAVFARICGELCILLVRRGTDPFKGMWALPGGFMEWGESCENAVAREIREETGLKGLKFMKFGVFSDPGRAPRGTVVSVTYLARAGVNQRRVRGGDDAAEAAWHPVNKRPRLAFDHDKVLSAALKSLKTLKSHKSVKSLC